MIPGSSAGPSVIRAAILGQDEGIFGPAARKHLSMAPRGRYFSLRFPWRTVAVAKFKVAVGNGLKLWGSSKL
jgi:hypothetical protein